MKAGDTVKHIPSGETWVLAVGPFDMIGGLFIMACGWPEEMVPFSRVELVKSCSDSECEEMLYKWSEMRRENGRIDWRTLEARNQLHELYSSLHYQI